MVISLLSLWTKLGGSVGTAIAYVSMSSARLDGAN
jgi:hypothetical protein